MGGEKLQKQIKAGSKEMTVKVRGKLAVPGIVMQFWKHGRLEVACTVAIPVIHARKDIQRFRNLKKQMEGGQK